MKELFEKIRNDQSIIDIYNKIQILEDKDKGEAYHNLHHVVNVYKLVEKLLIDLDYDEDFINKAKIAAFLHDVGTVNGKDNHAKRSYEFAKKYFENNNIDFPDKDLVLDAILNHSEGFNTNNIITLSLILSDKLDVKKTRVGKAAVNIEGIRQYLNINDIIINISNKLLTVEFIVNDNINVEELESYYFTKKIFKAIDAFCNKLNISYNVLMNGKKWTLKV